MFDPHPDSIMHALSRRDVRGPSDQIKLLIDSYDDKRSGFEFAVNPDGVKRDYRDEQRRQRRRLVERRLGRRDARRLAGLDGRVPDPALAAALRAGRRRTRSGSASGATSSAIAERVSWPLWSPTRNGIASQLGRLTGLTGLTTERRLELTPYVVTKNVQRTLPNARLRARSADHGRRRSQVRHHAERHARRDGESRTSARSRPIPRS